jgi:hypothetical protein
MLGSHLDNKHPYGVHVVTGREKASPAIGQAAEQAARKADRLLEKLAGSSAPQGAGRRAGRAGRS